MAYTLTTWQSAVHSHLDGWKQRMQRAGVTSLYRNRSKTPGRLWGLGDEFGEGRDCRGPRNFEAIAEIIPE